MFYAAVRQADRRKGSKGRGQQRTIGDARLHPKERAFSAQHACIIKPEFEANAELNAAFSQEGPGYWDFDLEKERVRER